MNDILEYKSYFATVRFNAEDEVFHGKIIGINDLISFEGTTVKELKIAFQDAVDDYLETCQLIGKNPEKTYKGSFNVRISSELHREAAHYASIKNISLNDLVKQAIAFVVSKPPDKLTINSILLILTIVSPAIFAGFFIGSNIRIDVITAVGGLG